MAHPTEQGGVHLKPDLEGIFTSLGILILSSPVSVPLTGLSWGIQPITFPYYDLSHQGDKLCATIKS